MNIIKTGQHASLFAALLAACSMAGAAAPAAKDARTAIAATVPADNATTSSSRTAAAPPATSDKHTGDDIAGDSELDGTRGGAGATVIDTRIAGQVSGNSSSNVQTGWNVIDGGSFANLTGIPIVIQNSGANVLIQNATVIQLQLQ